MISSIITVTTNNKSNKVQNITKKPTDLYRGIGPSSIVYYYIILYNIMLCVIILHIII